MKVTADTITTPQLLQLRDELTRIDSMFAIIDIALGRREPSSKAKRQALRSVADARRSAARAWNARHGGDSLKVTVDTITDEQIRALSEASAISIDLAYRAAYRDRLVGESKSAYMRARRAARARCAGAWNARHGGDS